MRILPNLYNFKIYPWCVIYLVFFAINGDLRGFTTPHPAEENISWSNTLSIHSSLLTTQYLDSAPKIHSPHKATIMALALPGAGQIYNRKYWKVPIVYAGMGGSLFAIGLFRSNMRFLNDSITQIYTVNKIPSAQLIEQRNNQRSRRDIAILCLAGVYVLQVLDATVDAHFFKFNINDKIGLNINPSSSQIIALNYRF